MKFLLILILMTACEAHDMADQERIRTYDPSPLFADGRSARVPVEGTVPRADTNAEKPAHLSLAELKRGEERFNIHCAPCHGETGEGNGMVVQRGYARPPDFHTDPLRALSPEAIFGFITMGFGAMPSYAADVAPRDRWLIASYVKALQLSRTVSLEAVPREEAQKLLEETP